MGDLVAQLYGSAAGVVSVVLIPQRMVFVSGTDAEGDGGPASKNSKCLRTRSNFCLNVV